ncbi:hypothetical protein GC176_04260 [bacterium]|nr:hypothetical protein [bacterium]
MDNSIDRRDFAKQTTAVVGSLFSGPLFSGRFAFGEDEDRSDRRLVLLGLNALARAHELDYFTDGHRGAALIAAHLMIDGNEMDERARSRIVELFDLNWATKPLCKPFPDEKPDPDGIARIGAALAANGETLLQVGHNAIFAMLAIKGFRLLPEAATPKRIDGICEMIRSFTPWHDIMPDKDVDPPPFTDAKAASQFILREARDAVDRFVGYGQGFAGHMLTFGQSLVELAAMGDVDWAESCRTAFRKYVTVTRQGPAADDKRYTDHRPSKLRPNQAEYWAKRGDHSVGIGHVFKYPYSYYELLRRANDAALAKEWDARAYHVF